MASASSLGDCVSGGYVLTTYADAKRYNAASPLLPPRVISASCDLAERIPDHWAMPWAGMTEPERRESVLFRLGSAPADLPAIGAWIGAKWKSGELVFTDVFQSPAVAREFVAAFLKKRELVVLLGLGLPRTLTGEFLERCKPAAALGPSAVYDMVRRAAALEPGGEPLGFELLCHSANLDCSWLCNLLERDAHARFGIRPNEFGLIPALEDATRLASCINQGELKAEPGWWAPWLLTRYPLE